MVSVYEPNDSTDYHMIVVLAVEGERVKIFDPDPIQTNSPHWLATTDFEYWWSDGGEPCWYAVINAD